jgi:hypothetical protein
MPRRLLLIAALAVCASLVAAHLKSGPATVIGGPW